jgi:DNA topoisomerase-1
MPRLKVSPWRSKPYEICIDPACATNQEPEFVVGKCPNCAANGLDKNVIGRRNPRTRKRSATCENFDECQTRYPLPAQGEITTTDEVCEHCGAPLIITTSRRGPWKRCINFDCPGKIAAEEEVAASKKATTKKKSASTTAKSTKKSAAKATKSKEA